MDFFGEKIEQEDDGGAAAEGVLGAKGVCLQCEEVCS